MPTNWTPQEDAILLREFPIWGGTKVDKRGFLPGRSRAAIHRRYHVLTGPSKRAHVKKYWNTKEIEEIKGELVSQTAAQVAQKHGTNEHALRQNLLHWGISINQLRMEAAERSPELCAGLNGNHTGASKSYGSNAAYRRYCQHHAGPGALLVLPPRTLVRIIMDMRRFLQEEANEPTVATRPYLAGPKSEPYYRKKGRPEA